MNNLHPVFQNILAAHGLEGSSEGRVSAPATDGAADVSPSSSPEALRSPAATVAKHTPTPWYAAKGFEDGTLGMVKALINGERKIIASVYGDHPECEPDAVMLANAELIARAVNNHGPLVDALEKALYALEEAEAILGGEYGDHYSILCQQMFDLRTKIDALKLAGAL